MSSIIDRYKRITKELAVKHEKPPPITVIDEELRKEPLKVKNRNVDFEVDDLYFLFKSLPKIMFDSEVYGQVSSLGFEVKDARKGYGLELWSESYDIPVALLGEETFAISKEYAEKDIQLADCLMEIYFKYGKQEKRPAHFV